MSRFIDITGNSYGRLYVLGFSHCEGKRSYWLCRCECKNLVILRKDHFAYPYSKQKSCGCLHRENSSKRMYEYHRKLKEDKKGGSK